MSQARSDYEQFKGDVEGTPFRIPFAAGAAPATFGGGPVTGGNAIASVGSGFASDSSLRLTDSNARQSQISEANLASARAFERYATQQSSLASSAAQSRDDGERDGGSGSLSDNNFLRRATSRFSRGAGVYFAVREINAVAQGQEQQDAQDRTLQTQGSTAFISQFRDQADQRLQDGLPTLIRTGFAAAINGLSGKASDDQQQFNAADAAQNGLRAVATGDQIYGQRLQFNSRQDRSAEQLRITQTRDPFAATTIRNSSQANSQIDELKNRDSDLRQQLSTARTNNDVPKINELTAQINELAKEFGGLTDSIIKNKAALDTKNQEDFDLYVSNARNRTASAQNQQAGNFLQAQAQEIDAKFNVQRDGAGKILSIGNNLPGSNLFNLLKPDVDNAMNVAGHADEQRRRDYQNETLADQLQLGRDRFGAQIARTEIERGDALAPGGIKITNPAEVNSINKRFDTLENITKQDRADALADANLNQATRRNQTAALLNRDPIGAEVAGIVGSSRSEEMGFLRQGPDFAAQAANARSLGRQQLDLLAQNYKDSFRGEQVDLRTSYVGNPRDSENPAKILAEIQNAKDDLDKPGQDGAVTTGGQSNTALLDEVKNNLPRNIAQAIAEMVSQ